MAFKYLYRIPHSRRACYYTTLCAAISVSDLIQRAEYQFSHRVQALTTFTFRKQQLLAI